MSEIRERPILFSGPMVRAILEGRKTQTRRVIKPQPHGILCRDSAAASGFSFDSPAHGDQLLTCPYGVPGDRLWVRETWMPDGADVRFEMMKRGDIPWEVRYAASEPGLGKMFKWHPSIHMPRAACRIKLEVVKVRVERVQSISPEDAVAEGLAKLSKDGGRTWKYGIPEADGLPGSEIGAEWHNWRISPVDAFEYRWNLLNDDGVRGFGWAKNPWVWVVDFKRVNP